MKLFLNGTLRDVSLGDLIHLASNVSKGLALPENGNYEPADLLLKPVKAFMYHDCDNRAHWITADTPDVVLQCNNTVFVPLHGVEYVRALFGNNQYLFFIAQVSPFYPIQGTIPLLPFEELEAYPAHTH